MTKVFDIRKKIIQFKDQKEILNHLILNLTILGFSNAVKSKRQINKIIWIILSLCSSGVCSYYSFKCISDYLSYEYISNINSYNEREIMFPVVSLCAYRNNNFTFDMLYLSLGYNEINDWKNLFVSYYDSNYGNCYRFNAGYNYSGNKVPFKFSVSNGLYHGLFMNLFVNNSNDYFGQYIVHIHNQTRIPNSLYNKGYFISTGVYNYFTLKRVYEQKLGEPYNQCLKDPDSFTYNKTLINFFKQINKTYYQQECFTFCENMKYIEQNLCDCTLTSYEQNVFPFCYYDKSFECSLNFQKEFELNIHKICNEYCPLECDSFVYDINHFSQAILATGNIKNGFDFPEFNTYENVSRNFLAIYVYYEDLKYTLISQQPKFQIFDLISNIGGLFGLFLGMGLLSFVEIFEVLLEAALLLFKK